METSCIQASASVYERSEPEPYVTVFGEPSNIWEYGVVCDHDDGFVCEERLKELKKYADKI